MRIGKSTKIRREEKGFPEFNLILFCSPNLKIKRTLEFRGIAKKQHKSSRILRIYYKSDTGIDTMEESISFLQKLGNKISIVFLRPDFRSRVVLNPQITYPRLGIAGCAFLGTTTDH